MRKALAQSVGDSPESKKRSLISGKKLLRSTSTQFKNRIQNTLDLSNKGSRVVEETLCDSNKYTSLNLSYNDIEVLPASFTGAPAFSKIRRLNLSGNKFTSLPECFEQMNRLESLKLRQNSFVMFPQVVCNISSLTKLDLSFNNITEVPSQIKQLVNLSKFTMHNNRVFRLPVEINSLTKLKVINMGNNPLLQPPLHICALGIPRMRDYLELCSKEEKTKFRSSSAVGFSTEPLTGPTLSMITTPEETRIFTISDIEQWYLQEKIQLYFTLESGITLCQGPRPYMEDRAEASVVEPCPKLLPNYKACYIGCYDGHGGSKVVDYLVKSLRETIINEWRKLVYAQLNLPVEPTDEDFENIRNQNSKGSIVYAFVKNAKEALLQGFAVVEEQMYQWWQNEMFPDGSTAVSCLMIENLLCVAHCGDSRAVLCRGGSGIPITKDHKPHLAAEKARIIAAGGTVKKWGGSYRVNGNLAMSRSLGDFFLKPCVSPVPDVTTVCLSPADTFLILATDGLWDVMNNADAANIVLNQPSPLAGTEELVKRALYNTSDNVSAVVLGLKWNYQYLDKIHPVPPGLMPNAEQ